MLYKVSPVSTFHTNNDQSISINTRKFFQEHPFFPISKSFRDIISSTKRLFLYRIVMCGKTGFQKVQKWSFSLVPCIKPTKAISFALLRNPYSVTSTKLDHNYWITLANRNHLVLQNTSAGIFNTSSTQTDQTINRCFC